MKPSDEDRLWSKVAIGDGCWEWRGHVTDGYGRLRFNGRKDGAHRASWILHNGPIPAGMHVLHRCDNRRCVRPDHLFLGSNAENVDDREAKHRGGQEKRLGERNGAAVLTESAVREIRRRVAAGESRRSLGRAFGVSETNIRLIVQRKKWAHVDEIEQQPAVPAEGTQAA